MWRVLAGVALALLGLGIMVLGATVLHKPETLSLYLGFEVFGILVIIAGIAVITRWQNEPRLKKLNRY